ncbi:hypothetical protein G7072_13290 [Nocardioides sp. HDW12B]|uniref:hypothetical protein n=1 Tax=Nocardioides sp. HDW12B TaxID=2714939 RepID=UPI0014096271|nr:hypothetical protein [Nocardioides sp. HDW12B]QIK67188.1 hypothetical protein G7072_13290 [Nocardioides sp. HDW12B]
MRAALLAAVGALVLGGCGGESVIADGSYAAEPSDVSAQVLTAPLRLAWRGDEVEVETGCTRIVAQAEVDEVGDAATLRLAAVESTSTCNPPDSDPDVWVEAFLRTGPTVERSEGGGFQLFDEEVSVSFHPE